jgi:hypothetical protein
MLTETHFRQGIRAVSGNRQITKQKKGEENAKNKKIGAIVPLAGAVC